MRSWRSSILPALVVALFVLPAPLAAQGGGGGRGGGGGGGGSDSGDLFGDLVHIKRDPTTGQPILQKKAILLPGDVPGVGYCPIPVDVYGIEIPLAADGCEADPAFADRLVEVDYFNRLSGARAGERNLRMHFDEVITKIREAEAVDSDPMGRLQMGTGCLPDGTCAEWSLVDAPFENLAFYHRLMKYGHVQTDPAEVDTSAHGDPALGTVYHPALRAEDWAKIRSSLAALLPRTSAAECFSGDTFTTACADRLPLTVEDFRHAAAFLGASGGKHEKITVDLVQYLNRILYITKDTRTDDFTDGTLPTLNTLPALIREEDGSIAPAPDGLPAPADERFVDFSLASYLRENVFSIPVAALVPTGTPGLWQENYAVSLLPFLRFINGPSVAASNMTAFVKNSSDALRSVEFFHNYEIPADISAVGAATTMVVPAAFAGVSASDQTVALFAMIADETVVNGGTVTFTVQDAASQIVGVPAISATVANGIAAASYTLPGGTPVGVLTIKAAYSGAAGFAPAYATSTLTVSETPPEPCVTSISPTTVAADPAGATISLAITTSSACFWSAVSNAAWITPASAAGIGSKTLAYVVEANATGAARTGTVTVETYVLTVTQAAASVPDAVVESTWGDFHLPLDGRADGALFDPQTRLWNFKSASATSITTFGPFGDTLTYQDALVPADYTGDGITDCAVYRPATGVWTIAPSCAATGHYTVTLGGAASDVPVPADFDGDGKTDLAVYRRATNSWHVLKGTGAATPTTPTTPTIPTVPCTTIQPAPDWVCVNGGWLPPDHPLATTPTSPETIVVEWGWSWTPVVPVPGDYDGDGKADFAYYATFIGSWWVLSSKTGGVLAVEWGMPGVTVIPVPADYDGDGRTDMAYFHAASAGWYIIPSATGGGKLTTFGTSSAAPVPSDYDGDGKVDIALYDAALRAFKVLSSTTNTVVTIDMSTVNAGAVPVLRKPQ